MPRAPREPVFGPRNLRKRERERAEKREATINRMNAERERRAQEDELMGGPAQPMTIQEKKKIIRDAGTDQKRGFGSKVSLIKDAKSLSSQITTKDVNEWWDLNRERKQKMKGYNSFVAPHPMYELQIDMFYYKYKQEHNEGKTKKEMDAPYGLLAVDPFTKKIHVVPINQRRHQDWMGAMDKIFKEFGGTPKVVYTDPDIAMTAEDMGKYLRTLGITWIRTRNHAQNAERAIRTIKHGLDERLEALGDDRVDKWYNYIDAVLEKYNKVEKSSVTGMTAEDATKPENEADVRTQLAIHAKHERKYPPIEVGDKVKVFKKKHQFAKERVGTWDDTLRKVDQIEEIHGQKRYHVPIIGWVIRSDLYKLPEARQRLVV